MKMLIRFSLIVLVLISTTYSAAAQCAMCKATAESATENIDKGIGEGLNAGIVYLMLIPYVLLATVGLVFYRKKITAIFRS